MKRKWRSLLALSTILAVSLSSVPAAYALETESTAVQPRYTYIDHVRAELSDNGNDTASFTVQCIAVSDVTKIVMEVELQKKGLLGIYSKQDEDSKTVYNSKGAFSGTFDIDSSKTYRIKHTYTVYTSSDSESGVVYSDPT